jgi:hypothetical protein
MSRHLHTLLGLQIEMQNLDFAQEMIDDGRFIAGDNTELNTLLDRQQANVNEQRAKLLVTFYKISSTN